VTYPLLALVGRIHHHGFHEDEGYASFQHKPRPTRRKTLPHPHLVHASLGNQQTFFLLSGYIPDDDRRRRHNATERRRHSVWSWCYDSDGRFLHRIQPSVFKSAVLCGRECRGPFRVG